MMRCGWGGTLLPGAQHDEAAGQTGRTHGNRHIMRVACGLDNTKGFEEFVEGGRRRIKRRTHSRCTATTSTTLISTSKIGH